MGAGPVTSPAVKAKGLAKKPRLNWKLKPPHDKFAQGLVVSGFDALPCANVLFLFFAWPENGPDGPPASGNGAWLQSLHAVAPTTDADKPEPKSAALAFTWTGLQKMGLGKDALATFSAPFREGMYQEDRLRRLGDMINGQWQETVIKEGSRWSANIPARKAKAAGEGPIAEIGGPPELQEREVLTPITVHALLVLYESDKERLDKWRKEVEATLNRANVKVVHQLSLDLHLDKNGIGREHFGFADGLSQPIPFGDKGRDEIADDCVILSDGSTAKRDPWHGVPLGEILLGHINAHHEKAPAPFVQDDDDARAAGLSTVGAPEGFRSLGLDGSYMVVRELRQYVAAFWQSLEAAAAKIRAHDPKGPPITADWLAERIIGRNLDGHLLCPQSQYPSGYLPPDKDNNNLAQNAFGFLKTDPHGVGCPLGSHVRRGNPRDSLAKDLASAQTLLDAANNHRILRRGRKFGPLPPANRLDDDKQERGLLFVCLNTDIARQFEFVQQNWILNRNFATLYDGTDPFIGPKGQFTIPEDPLRRIIEVKTFIQLAGGEYFFLPSLPAINYLAAL
jgi:Dyp-type peroxidase family